MIRRHTAYSLLSAIVVGLAPIGCSSAHDELPRVPIAGTVNLDGKPLPEGAILFSPVAGAGTAVASSSGQIKDGAFTIPRDHGPVPGDYKVVISHLDQPEGHVPMPRPGKKVVRPKELIPVEYNSKTTLTEKIPAGGKSDLKYDLQSKSKSKSK